MGCQAPLSMGFSRQEYWSRLPFASPGDLSDPGIKPGSPAVQADSLPSEPCLEGCYPLLLKTCFYVVISVTKAPVLEYGQKLPS